MAAAVVVGSLLGGGVGCGGDDGPTPAGTLDDHPVASRYPRARLPWPVRTDEFDRDGYATFVGRRIHFAPRDNFADHLEWQGALTAVVALDDRVVVVFPPADREGFDLAIGGIDRPWERIPLADILPMQVGDLEAVRDGEGTVWIALRKRRGDQEITLYRWRPGEPVTSEIIPRPYPVVARSFHDTCEDLALGITPSGAQDLVFQQVDSQGRSEVLHLHRASASAPWETRVVLSSSTLQSAPPATQRLFAVGCRNVLAHDESGRPVVLTMDQELHTQVLDDVQVTPLPMPKIRSWSLFLGADGTWLSARTGSLPDERRFTAGAVLGLWDDTDDSYVAQVDLERHPEGFLLAGPSLPPEFQELRHGYSMLAVSLAHDFAAVGFGDYEHETVQPQPWEWARSGGKLVVGECGWMVHGEPVRAGQRRREPVAGRGGPCQFEPRAPVIASEIGTDARFGNFARGVRPYDVAVCIEGEDQLVICHGAHRPGDPAALYAVDDLPRIASVEPASGQLTGSTPIVITMNRPMTEGESGSFGLVRTIDGGAIDHRFTWDEATGVLTITPQQPWVPGVQVRVEAFYVHGDRHAEPWLYLGTPVPVARFRAGEAPRLPDPRDVPPRFSCDVGGGFARASDGLCTFVETWRPSAPNSVPLTFPYDRARAATEPSLEHPGGAVVPTTAGILAGVFQLQWSAPLEGDTRYEIVLPADAKNLVGSSIHPDDQRLGMITSVPLPAITSSVPAPNATGVDRSAPLAIVFNTPVTFPAGAATLVAGATSVPLSLVQLDTVSFQLLHDPLSPLTTYTLALSAQIQNAEGEPLVGAPVTFTFTTGS